MSSHCVHKASAAGSVPAAVRTKQEAVELGHSVRFRDVPVMSALPLIADMRADILDGSEGPKAAVPRHLRRDPTINLAADQGTAPASA
jgi:hypothetical protein